jgi:hypothetical protein
MLKKGVVREAHIYKPLAYLVAASGQYHKPHFFIDLTRKSKFLSLLSFIISLSFGRKLAVGVSDRRCEDLLRTGFDRTPRAPD